MYFDYNILYSILLYTQWHRAIIRAALLEEAAGNEARCSVLRAIIPRYVIVISTTGKRNYPLGK